MKRTVVLAVLAFLFAASTAIAQKAPDHIEAKKAALQSATAWLSLVDQGKYDASWLHTSKEFQQAVSQDKWSQMVHAARSPLGALHSRHLSKSTYTTSVPGGPDGQYVILRFDTSFAHKTSAVETLAMVLQNGQWRAAGYFVK